MSHSRQQRPRAAARLATCQDAGARATTHTANPPAQTTVGSGPPPAADATQGATPAVAPVALGVGSDTARYGHDATFRRADLPPAAAALKLVESAVGYQQLRQRLDAIAHQHGGHVHFHFRLDLAGR